MSQILGWQVTVAGVRLAHILRQHFPAVQGAFSVSPTDPMANLLIPLDLEVVIMMYDLRRYAAILQISRTPDCVGILGPRQGIERLLSTIPSLSEGAPQWPHASVGLDIGGSTPEAAALSLLSEIQRVFTRRHGFPLRDRDGPIHDPLSRSANEVDA